MWSQGSDNAGAINTIVPLKEHILSMMRGIREGREKGVDALKLVPIENPLQGVLSKKPLDRGTEKRKRANRRFALVAKRST